MEEQTPVYTNISTKFYDMYSLSFFEKIGGIYQKEQLLKKTPLGLYFLCKLEIYGETFRGVIYQSRTKNCIVSIAEEAERNAYRVFFDTCRAKIDTFDEETQIKLHSENAFYGISNFIYPVLEFIALIFFVFSIKELFWGWQRNGFFYLLAAGIIVLLTRLSRYYKYKEY